MSTLGTVYGGQFTFYITPNDLVKLWMVENDKKTEVLNLFLYSCHRRNGKNILKGF